VLEDGRTSSRYMPLSGCPCSGEDCPARRIAPPPVPSHSPSPGDGGKAGCGLRPFPIPAARDLQPSLSSPSPQSRNKNSGGEASSMELTDIVAYCSENEASLSKHVLILCDRIVQRTYPKDFHSMACIMYKRRRECHIEKYVKGNNASNHASSRHRQSSRDGL